MKIINIDLTLLAKQIALMGYLKSDLLDDHFKEDHQVLIDRVLDMFYDIETYIQEDGQVLLKNGN